MATRNTDMGVLQNKTLRRALFLDQPTQYNIKRREVMMRRKRFVSAALATLLALTMTACGGDSNE